MLFFCLKLFFICICITKPGKRIRAKSSYKLAQASYKQLCLASYSGTSTVALTNLSPYRTRIVPRSNFEVKILKNYPTEIKC